MAGSNIHETPSQCPLYPRLPHESVHGQQAALEFSLSKILALIHKRCLIKRPDLHRLNTHAEQILSQLAGFPIEVAEVAVARCNSNPISRLAPKQLVNRLSGQLSQ
jgi:hypothetical protein